MQAQVAEATGAPPAPPFNGGQAPAPRPPINIFDKAVCLAVTYSGIGNRRKVSTATIEVDADKSMIAVSKILLDSKELQAIHLLDARVRIYLHGICLPSLFRNGVFLLPVELVEEVEGRLKDFEVERKNLVDDLVRAIPQRVGEAAARLRGQFNEDDYPGVERVSETQFRVADASKIRNEFDLSWQYVAFSVPGKLKQINASIFESERKKAEQKWAEATIAIEQMLRTSMSSLVDHLVDRLSASPDGKRKRFHATAITNLQEFLGTFRARNITEDKELSDLVERAQQLIDGVDPALLRTNEGLRDVIRSGFEQIRGKLDTMVVDQPDRMITFDDE